ncbi:50S ribosomal protein L29 [Desulfovibrio porci]
MSAEELRGKLAEQRQELMNARFKHAAAQLEKTSELKAMRKQVARIETVLNEKEQRA